MSPSPYEERSAEGNRDRRGEEQYAQWLHEERPRRRAGEQRADGPREGERRNGEQRYGERRPEYGAPDRRGPDLTEQPVDGDEVEQYRDSPVGPLVRERRPPYRRESGQIAAVLLYQNGGHSVVWPDRRDDHDKPRLRPPYTVFEVLLGRNVTSFELALPAAGDAQFFDARAEVHWEVEEPHTVVMKRVWDVRELLHGELLLALRQLSRRFRLTDAQRADEAVQEELAKGRIDLGRDLGLRLRIHVFIDLSDVVRQRKSERDDIDFDMSRDEAQAEADRRKDAMERRLVRERAAELEAVFRRGQEAEIIHLMARNPAKEWEIREAIREQKREGQTDLINLFNRLLDTGHLERHDIGDQMFETLRLLRESGGAVLGGVTDQMLLGQRPRHELEEGPAARRRREEAPRAHRTDDGDGFGDDTRSGYRDDRANGYADDHGEPDRPPWDDEPRVYRPTRVESSAERDRDARRERADRDDEHGGARRGSRPSADFDDWGDE
ncbi:MULTISPECIES: hypothetical protein [unclassified Streptomyces]|uniref:hypothetical protein n=1 Tax=unclassified Streptomyces TaxID=2593676 RepID=UPI002E797857|nr:hypothetical protein [Streptomyces sp. JV176]MEE1799285.1 hypothetical protein [Streptomyces sp. JV176]